MNRRVKKWAVGQWRVNPSWESESKMCRGQWAQLCTPRIFLRWEDLTHTTTQRHTHTRGREREKKGAWEFPARFSITPGLYKDQISGRRVLKRTRDTEEEADGSAWVSERALRRSWGASTRRRNSHNLIHRGACTFLSSLTLLICPLTHLWTHLILVFGWTLYPVMFSRCSFTVCSVMFYLRFFFDAHVHFIAQCICYSSHFTTLYVLSFAFSA